MGWTPHPLSSGILGVAGWVEGGSCPEHGTSDVEEAVCDRSQGASMAMSPGAQGGVLGAAYGIVLCGDAGPMVDGVGEPLMAGISAQHEAAFAGPPGDGCDACKAAQGVIISALQGIRSLCQQRGEDDPPDSRQGGEDVGVTLLWLPRLSLFGGAERGGQAVDLSMSVADLAIDQTDAIDQRQDVSAGGFGSAIGDGDGLLAQDVEKLGGVEAADTVALEDFRDCSFADALGFVRGGHRLPEVDQPGRAEVIVQFEEGREVAPELLTHTVCEAGALGAELLGDARPFPELDDQRIGIGEASKAMRIGAQGRRQDQAVAAVVLGTGWAVAIAEAVHLLGIDGPDTEPASHQRLNHRTMRHLDGEVDPAGIVGTALGQQPICQGGEGLAGMLEDFFADVAALLVEEPHEMALAGPIDTGIPLLLSVHAPAPASMTSHRDPDQNLYGHSARMRRDRRRLPTGHRSRPIRRGTCPPQVIGSQGGVGCFRRTGSIPAQYDIRAVARGTTGAPLRYTPLVPRRLLQEPPGKGTGGP